MKMRSGKVVPLGSINQGGKENGCERQSPETAPREAERGKREGEKFCGEWARSGPRRSPSPRFPPRRVPSLELRRRDSGEIAPLIPSASRVSLTLTIAILPPLRLSAFHQPPGESGAPGRCFPARRPGTPNPESPGAQAVLGRNGVTSSRRPASQRKGDQCGAARQRGEDAWAESATPEQTWAPFPVLCCPLVG
ncbi:unnamed protein product [Rangifer tarandus platyrhynchus]|uniref:Uncharacterized protein n=2 Tax=Rangifer tarandus platyrhynchus TaxID=3082113 RepID=A0ABN8Z3F4_RANTA|nr:unnamed protein product [Rangifer tarandus platyrhynchus]CAI9704629.1 unnamed protein product [Rangifer tarandus platyrhynchus]